MAKTESDYRHLAEQTDAKRLAMEAKLEAARDEVEELREELGERGAEIRSLQQQLQLAKLQLHQAGLMQQHLRQQPDQERRQTGSEAARQSALHKRAVSGLQRSLELSLSDGEELRRRLEEVRARCASLAKRHKAQMDALRGKLKRARSETETAREESRELKRAAVVREAECDAKMAGVATVASKIRNQKRKAKSVAKKQARAMRGQRDDAVTRLADTIRDLDATEAAVSAMKAERDDAQRLVEELQQRLQAEPAVGHDETFLQLLAEGSTRHYSPKCMEILRAILLTGLAHARVLPTMKSVFLALNITADQLPTLAVVKKAALEIKVLTGAHAAERLRLIQEDDNWQVTLSTDASTKAKMSVFATAVEARRRRKDGTVQRQTTVLPYTQPKSGSAKDEAAATEAAFSLAEVLLPDSRKPAYPLVDTPTGSITDTAMSAILVATGLDFTSDSIFFCSMHGTPSWLPAPPACNAML